MHWLEQRLGALHDAVNRHAAFRHTSDTDAARAARQGAIDKLHELVEEVEVRPGINGCFASHEGMLVASAGDHDLEQYAALAQRLFDISETSATSEEIGAFEQLVVIGAALKVAMFRVGDFTVGVVAPKATQLGTVLA